MTRNKLNEEIVPEGVSRETFVDRILDSMANAHSHVDIVQEFGGYALIRTFKTDGELLPEHRIPREEVLGCTETLKEMQDAIIQEEGPRFLPSVQMSNVEPEVILEPKLTAAISNSGDVVRVRPSKEGEPLTQEDHIQLQILEHQVTDHPETVISNSPMVLDGHHPTDLNRTAETHSHEQLHHLTAPAKNEANNSRKCSADSDHRREFQRTHKVEPGREGGLSR